jgi:DNA-binding transcriptional MerR regulator
MYLRSAYDAGVQRLFSLASKKALLEAEKSQTALADNSEYTALAEELAELRAELDETIHELGERDDFATIYRDLERELAEGNSVPVMTEEDGEPDLPAGDDDPHDLDDSDE